MSQIRAGSMDENSTGPIVRCAEDHWKLVFTENNPAGVMDIRDVACQGCLACRFLRYTANDECKRKSSGDNVHVTYDTLVLRMLVHSLL
eukprot:m.4399 g.4399  ORF g.4399 m.4399 type:complete len:89 (+) comp3319_c0_seq2:1017-1283(+)